MGTFLVVFVPQQCGDDVCSLSDNFSNDALLNRAALACNFAAFATVLGFYAVEIKRENWCIQYLDIDPNRSNNHLDDEIEGYPVLKSEMASLNKQYLCALCCSDPYGSQFRCPNCNRHDYAGSNIDISPEFRPA